MEEMSKKYSSLPPNYVSLRDLQERRLREQEQRQKEEEEQERRIEQKRLKEEGENVRRKKEEEERKLQESRKILENGANPSSIRGNWKKYRKVPGQQNQMKEGMDSTLKNQEPKIAAAEEGAKPYQKQKLEELKKKPKRKRYTKNSKNRESKTESKTDGDLHELPRSENDQIEVIPVPSSEVKTQVASPGNATDTNQTADIVGRIAVLSVADDQKTVEKESEIIGGVGGNRATVVVNPGFRSSRRSSMKGTAEIALKPGNLTVGDDLKAVETGYENRVNGNDSAVAMSVDRGFRTSRRFSNRGKWRDANKVWVRKGEMGGKNMKKSIG